MARRAFTAPSVSTHDLVLTDTGFRVEASRLKRWIGGALLLIFAGFTAGGAYSVVVEAWGSWTVLWTVPLALLSVGCGWVAVRPWRAWDLSVGDGVLVVRGQRVDPVGPVPLTQVDATLYTHTTHRSKDSRGRRRTKHTYRVGALLEDGTVVGLFQSSDRNEAARARDALEAALVASGNPEAPRLDHVPDARTRDDARQAPQVPQEGWPEPWPHPRFEVRAEEDGVWMTLRRERSGFPRATLIATAAAAVASVAVLGWLYAAHGPWGLVPIVGPGGAGTEFLRMLAYGPALFLLEAALRHRGVPPWLRGGPLHLVVQPGKLLVVGAKRAVLARFDLAPVHDLTVEGSALALVTTEGATPLPVGPAVEPGDLDWVRAALRHAMVEHGEWQPGRSPGALARAAGDAGSA